MFGLSALVPPAGRAGAGSGNVEAASVPAAGVAEEAADFAASASSALRMAASSGAGEGGACCANANGPPPRRTNASATDSRTFIPERLLHPDGEGGGSGADERPEQDLARAENAPGQGQSDLLSHQKFECLLPGRGRGRERVH